MPTPFTHLNISQRLLQDSLVPPAYRDLIMAQLPAFLLGSVVADARVSSGVGREVTHFYSYNDPIVEHPWCVMLDEHPTLKSPRDESHRAFLAGYVAHLATDEAWALKMVYPNFGAREWVGVERRDKFFALHLLLTYMDERDELSLEAWHPATLMQCEPNHWLPFMPDEVLCSWRDMVAEQLSPDGHSQTLNIFGSRLDLEPLYIRGIMDSEDIMTQRLWQHIPKLLLEQAESQVYAYSRDQLCIYLTQFS